MSTTIRICAVVNFRSFTYKTSQKYWLEIANQLNAVDPVSKNWKQWRKTWQDIKSKAKAKGSEVKKRRGMTGGGEPIKELTGEEEKKKLNGSIRNYWTSKCTNFRSFIYF